MYCPDTKKGKAALLGFVVLLLLTGCAGPAGVTDAPDTPTATMPSRAVAIETPTDAPEPAGPKTITLWHRWSEGQAGTIRALLDNYQTNRPDVTVKMEYQADLYDALRAAKTGGAPDIVALPGDRIAEFAGEGLLTPLDPYVDATWLSETYLSTSIDALRLDGQVWGLPLGVQTITFIYNLDIITDAELSAQTSDILAKARAYQAAHDGIWYLAYPAQDDIYFAAPWFYGAGAWYAREDGSVGLNTPAGKSTATFLASLREIMPPDVGYTTADALFKSGQAAITVNGSWYLPELEAAGVSYGLQIMPVVSASGQPARPLVSVDGLMLGAASGYRQTSTQVIAYLTNAESELQMARQFGAVPANKMAIQRAGDESLAIITHFARQAELGQGVPATPNWGATWAPVQSLLRALWAGEPVEAALETAQREAEQSVSALRAR